jgi:hypothetical protein
MDPEEAELRIQALDRERQEILRLRDLDEYHADRYYAMKKEEEKRLLKMQRAAEEEKKRRKEQQRIAKLTTYEWAAEQYQQAMAERERKREIARQDAADREIKKPATDFSSIGYTSFVDAATDEVLPTPFDPESTGFFGNKLEAPEIDTKQLYYDRAVEKDMENNDVMDDEDMFGGTRRRKRKAKRTRRRKTRNRKRKKGFGFWGLMSIGR